jgi:diguanylate cyclase (GGDEF)-like protein
MTSRAAQARKQVPPQGHPALLAEAFETLPAPAAVADSDDRILFANAAFRRLFGEAGRVPAGLPAARRRLGRDAWLVAAGPEQPARRDALTGIPDRLALREALREEAGREGALLLLDLDRFKGINDTLGHPVGDRLLCRVVERVQVALDDSDLLVRLGGDEFGVLQRGGPQPAGAAALAGRLVDLVARSYVVDGHLLNVGASVGVAVLGRDGDDPDALLKSADLALYRAKEEGRGRYCFFEPEMGARAQARRALELDLRRAVVLRQFEVHYQPQMNLAAGRVAGFEALVRWQHPRDGMVAPAEFVPLAEETGLIVPIGEWVLRTACREAAAWPAHLTLSVNLSPVQFGRAGLLETVTSALAQSGLPPERLELEITETLLLQETGATLALLHRLKALGVRIAMDDFGTGYSSLSYLRTFPFDEIKVDRSFIAAGTDAGTAAILRAIVTLGASLGMTVVAEGIETPEQLAFATRQGCDAVQGYLIGRPLPFAEALAAMEGTGRVAVA